MYDILGTTRQKNRRREKEEENKTTIKKMDSFQMSNVFLFLLAIIFGSESVHKEIQNGSDKIYTRGDEWVRLVLVIAATIIWYTTSVGDNFCGFILQLSRRSVRRCSSGTLPSIV
jgi:hypothetical protein